MRCGLTAFLSGSLLPCGLPQWKLITLRPSSAEVYYLVAFLSGNVLPYGLPQRKFITLRPSSAEVYYLTAFLSGSLLPCGLPQRTCITLRPSSAEVYYLAAFLSGSLLHMFGNWSRVFWVNYLETLNIIYIYIESDIYRIVILSVFFK
jgi:hypothetical protein